MIQMYFETAIAVARVASSHAVLIASVELHASSNDLERKFSVRNAEFVCAVSGKVLVRANMTSII